MENCNIRSVNKEELSEVVNLCEAHAAYEQLDFSRNGQEQRFVRDLFGVVPKLYCLVVEENNTLLAYATYMKQYATWDAAEYIYLDCIFVVKKHRSRGIGEQLMNRIKLETSKLKCQLIQWQTPTFNSGAIRFYERIGAVKKSKERFFLTTNNKTNLILNHD